MVPLHPETVADDTQTLRCVVPAGTLSFAGVPTRLPAPMHDLLDGGLLTAVVVEPAGVLTTLAAGRAWRDDGATVRAALQAALETPQDWLPPHGAAPADDLLRTAVDQVLTGTVGDYIRSHGGQVTLASAHDGEVEVVLSGACRHCPASDLTLTDRIETGVRALYPDLRSLTARDADAPSAGRRLLRLLPLGPR